MRHVKNISLLIAGSLLLLHTLVPHDHHSELGEIEHLEQHQQADDLFDFLQLAFHMDLGGEHLENFHKTNFFFLLPDLQVSNSRIQFHQSVNSKVPPLESSAYSSLEEKQFQAFRGPPSLG